VRRIVIVNRGEPAMRLIHAARELERQRGEPLTIIALFTDPDRGAMFVREADVAFHLGPAQVPVRGGADGTQQSAYLDYQRLAEALRATRADAAWVGWGFVAEHAAFAELCRDLGVVFVGPSPEAMRKLGDKIAAKKLAETAGVPVAPWSGGPVETVAEAQAQAARIGYPLVIKATAGGGGLRVRTVDRHCED
jgi:acetyl/propionyl-CoA carboxylase alpha subunit